LSVVLKDEVSARDVMIVIKLRYCVQLSGSGRRWTEGELRMRLVNPERFNPATIMPSYQRTENLARVAPAFRGKPILTPQQIEDVVAYLATLK
jgi:L-cysteine S-thiosulfotransferase